jgi:hypothetical protein
MDVRARPSVLILATILALGSAISVAQPIGVGPISDVHLDRFISDPNQRGGTLVINAGRGTYRFIADVQDPITYEINTPYATLAMRGAVLEMTMEGVNCERIKLVRGNFQATAFLGQSISVTEHNLPATIVSGQSTLVTEPNTVVTACSQVPIDVLTTLAGAAVIAATQSHKKSVPINPPISPN